jgi:SAM-dependent methyltransferase
MMRAEAMTPRLDIPSGALVLELGSGHRPHPRADVLTDKYLDDAERGGHLVMDRPFVQADAQKLPFRPKVFDYVICRHVLEHLEDPAAFFHEIGRVGRAGYIETPSFIWEYLHPTRTYHRWYVLEIDDQLVMVRKPADGKQPLFGRLFETLNANSPEYRLFVRRYADLFYVRHRWRDRVDYCVEPLDDERRSWFVEPWDSVVVARFVPPRSQGRQALDLLLGALGSVWGGLRRRLNRLALLARRRPIDLAALMQCPVCSWQSVEIRVGRATCPKCGWHTVVVLPE